jgi:hypothetical protein
MFPVGNKSVFEDVADTDKIAAELSVSETEKTMLERVFGQVD